MRRLLLCALASGVFGAMFATAMQSQASLAAIAAAVQRVQDTRAETDLKTIAGQLTTIHTDLMTLEQTITTSAQTTTNAVKNASVTASSDATALWAIASDTCRGVWQSGGNCIELPPPIATP